MSVYIPSTLKSPVTGFSSIASPAPKTGGGEEVDGVPLFWRTESMEGELSEEEADADDGAETSACGTVRCGNVDTGGFSCCRNMPGDGRLFCDAADEVFKEIGFSL